MNGLSSSESRFHGYAATVRRPHLRFPKHFRLGKATLPALFLLSMCFIILYKSHSPRPFYLVEFLLPIMSLRIARTAMSSARNPAVSKQRLTQVHRHFSSSASARKEIQEAYIISASRTPTAKVKKNLPQNLSTSFPTVSNSTN